MSKRLKVAVLGGGSFGTAIANIIACNNHQTFLWMRSSEQAGACESARQNARYLPGYLLHEQLAITSDLEEAVVGADLVFVSIPSHSFRAVTQQMKPLLGDGAMVVSTAKGIEPEGFTLMSQILEQELPGHPIGVLSGPNFAKEIVQQQQTGTVIASEYENVISCVQETLKSSTFRVYANHDRSSGFASMSLEIMPCSIIA